MAKFWSAKPLPRYDAKPFRANGIGYLVDVRGNRLPGVTPIIEATKLPEEKARLARWRQSKGAEANRIVSTACQRGKLGHAHIERYFLGEKAPCPEPIRRHWDNLLPILQNIHNVRLVEGTVFHFYEGYAGRVDCVASFDDIPCVIEFKFADKIKPLYDEPLQLAAYCGALNRQYGSPYGVRIKNALLIVATPDEAVVTWFDPDEVKKYWNRWQQRVAKFWRQTKAIA